MAKRLLTPHRWVAYGGLWAMALLVLLGVKCSSSDDDHDESLRVQRIDIVDLTIAEENPIPYPAFPDGITPSLGAGLVLRELTEDNQLAFTLLTNRGPTADTPPTLSNQGTRLFAVPDYNPQWFELQIDLNNQASQTLTQQVTLQQQNQPVQGVLPASASELALDNQLKQLSPSPDLALNPADLVAFDDQQANTSGYWLADQYGPSLLQVSQDGQILKRLLPQGSVAADGEKILPSILLERRLDQGFSALARNRDNGLLYAVMQNVLAIGDQPPFIRIVTFDPQSQQIQQFAYPIADLAGDPQQVFIGAARWLDGQRLLVSVYGEDNGQRFNYLQTIDLQNASDITNLTVSADVDGNGVKNLPLEWIGSVDIHGNVIAKPQAVNYAQRDKLLNLRDYGWTSDQATGLALVERNAIAVMNNSEYGLQSVLKDPVPGAERIRDYRVDPQTGILYRADDPNDPLLTTLVIEPTDNHNELWIFYLNQAIYSRE